MAKKKVPAAKAGGKAERKMAARAEQRTAKAEGKRAREIAKLGARLDHVRELRAAAEVLIGSLEGRLRELTGPATPAESVAVAAPGALGKSTPTRRATSTAASRPARTTARPKAPGPRRPRAGTPPAG
jgi:hypothetical protein